MRFRPGQNLADVPSGRAAAVVAQAEKERVVRAGIGLQEGEGFLQSHDHVVAFVLVGAVNALGVLVNQQLAAGGAAPPPSGAPRGIAGAGDGHVFHTGGGVEVAKAGGVTEGIGGPDDLRTASEAGVQVGAAFQQLTAKSFRGGQIGVGLEEGAAHDIPTACFHELLNLFEGRGVFAFELAVDERLATHEGEVVKLLHQGDDGAAGGHARREPFA